MNESNLPPLSKPQFPRYELSALVFAVFFPTLITLVYFFALSPLDERIQQAAFAVGKIFQFTFPLIWVLLVRRERIVFNRPHVKGMLVGFGFGLTIFAGILGAYHFWLKPAGFFVAPAEAVQDKVEGMGLDSTLRFAATAVFYSLVHSFLEEYYWRWFVFGRLERRIPYLTALVISSLGFMLHHVFLLSFYFKGDYFTIGLFSLGVAIGGAAWGGLYHWTRSLSGPWLSHLMVDAAIFLLGYDLLRNML